MEPVQINWVVATSLNRKNVEPVGICMCLSPLLIGQQVQVRPTFPNEILEGIKRRVVTLPFEMCSPPGLKCNDDLFSATHSYTKA